MKKKKRKREREREKPFHALLIQKTTTVRFIFYEANACSDLNFIEIISFTIKSYVACLAFAKDFDHWLRHVVKKAMSNYAPYSYDIKRKRKTSL